jgi:hypothetical protein
MQLPPLILETDEDRHRNQEAVNRKQTRLTEKRNER